MTTKSWTTIAESQYPWERDALDFVRQRFPDHEPYRAWSNFEFIADDGSVNEVDLLALTPVGLFLIEIKSRPGRLRGDAGTWTWETDGRLSTADNPLIAANLKAKKLRSLLERQKAVKGGKHPLPFIEPLIFCSAPDLKCDLQSTARYRICLRDRDATTDAPARPGIIAAIKFRQCQGLDEQPKGGGDKPTAKMLSQAMDQAGIRPSQRHRKVSDYKLDQLISAGPGYQDWEATHVALPDAKRRVRLYLVRAGATPEDRKTIERAALREFQLLETLQHPGILRIHGFTEHELGPALIFEHFPAAMRLDHFLAERGDRLGSDVRLDLLRQLAEIVRFAHDKKVVHRALSPQSVLITNPDSDQPQIKVFNWQVGYRASSPTTVVTREISATTHVDRLVEDVTSAYMAPETFSLAPNESAGEHLDVFSLGAIAYQLFSGQPPAANGLELSNKLRETKGLQISAVLNGAGECLQYLVQFATHPEVASRIDSVADFLDSLDAVQKELTAPEHDVVEDPTKAQQGDRLRGGFEVIKRLGQGACSVALLVQRDGKEYVLKAANDPQHNDRLRGEGAVLDKLRHQHIVKYFETLEIGDRVCVLMERAGQETLRERLRKDGKLHADLLQRFGEDLLGVVNFLEEQGIPHRDLKPDNIGVGPVGRGDRLHLLLFDFSLSRTPPENIRAGTNGYLDPLLPLRKPTPRWDLHAERYGVAVTLYELAAGYDQLPIWGDGTSDPSHLACEITIDAELFDANLREGLTDFFGKAFRRDPAQRFDNAEAMLDAWRECFKQAERAGPLSDHADEETLQKLLAEATFETPVTELGLGTRAANALDRANIMTVEDLLSISPWKIQRMRGVGKRTSREMLLAARILRKRLGKPDSEQEVTKGLEETPDELADVDVGRLSVDLLAKLVTKTTARSQGTKETRSLLALLGLDAGWTAVWPSQSEAARHLDTTPLTVHNAVKKAVSRWSREKAITRLREDLVEMLKTLGGVSSVEELAEGVLAARGSAQNEPLRTRFVLAVTRAAVEVERDLADPRLFVRRDHDRVLVATQAELNGYAGRLGVVADQLADQDPLAAPARVLEKLRSVSPPADAEPLSDARLVRLAAAASQHAAVSAQKELYLQGMEALRAVKLSQGALLGVPHLTVEQVRERVGSRYPEAAALPDRPLLDELLRAAGIDLHWDETARQGQGCYVSRIRDAVSVTTGTEPIPRVPTSAEPSETVEITPEIATAREFEERLQRATKDGAFLTLMVSPRSYHQAQQELCRRFPVQLVDFESVFIRALRGVAEKAKVKWDLVLQTDAKPNQGDWDKLMLLVGRTMKDVEEFLVLGSSFLAEDGREALGGGSWVLGYDGKPVRSDVPASSGRVDPNKPRTKNQVPRTLLLVYPGLLARYDQMPYLERWREQVGHRDGIHGLWILVPNDQQAVLDQKAIPIIGPGQRARIPESWLNNVHRG